MTAVTETKSELSYDITTITAEINSYKQIAGNAIFEIGKRLKHVKENDLTHGEFGKWLEDSVSFTDRQARRLMQVAEEFKTDDVVRIGTSKVFELIQLPAEIDREQFISEKHEVNGKQKTVDEMTVRELREVKKALKELEQQRDAAAQSESIAVSRAEKAEEDNALLRDTLESIHDSETATDGNYESPYGVKLGDEIYAAFDELSAWQKKYSWIETDRDEFKMLAEANSDFAREFTRLDKFWRRLSDVFHSVDGKGVYTTEEVSKDIIDADFTEV